MKPLPNGLASRGQAHVTDLLAAGCAAAFIVILGIAAYWDPTIRLLHLFEALLFATAAGAMPTTVYGLPSSIRGRPTAALLRSKRRCHKRSLMMTTGAAPSRSSSGRKARPRMRGTPSTENSSGEISRPDSYSASPGSLTVPPP